MEETRKMLTAQGFTHLPVHWPEWERLGDTIHSLERGKNR
jgi:hypothetical protein